MTFWGSTSTMPLAERQAPRAIVLLRPFIFIVYAIRVSSVDFVFLLLRQWLYQTHYCNIRRDRYRGQVRSIRQ